MEVILPWKTFQEIAEVLGWDLDADAKTDLRQTRRDLAKGNRKAFTIDPKKRTVVVAHLGPRGDSYK